MSMNINGLGNTYNDINTNSRQYKALKEKGWLSGVIENESMMSLEEKMIYEIFGGRDTPIAFSFPCLTVALYVSVFALVYFYPWLRDVNDHHIEII